MMIRAGLIAFGLWCLWASAAQADIQLSDGEGFTIEGEVLSYDGEFYRLTTEAGTLVIDGRGLTCTGADCPLAPDNVMTLSASDGGTWRLILTLMRGYARDDGVPMREGFGPAGVQRVTLTDPETEAELVFERRQRGGDVQVLRAAGDRLGAAARETPLGFDAVTPVVFAGNPVTEMTLLGLRTALAGEFDRWTGLGGEDINVTIVWPGELAGSAVVQFGLQPGPDALVVDDFRAATQAIARTPGGLALLPASELRTAVPLVVTGVCGRGTLGMGDAVRTGDYPLSDVIVLRGPARRGPPLLRDFITWLSSPAAFEAVRRAGFLDLSVGVIDAAFDGRQEANLRGVTLGGVAAPEQAVSALDGARRLNVAMRFEDGSSLPDAAGLIQIARLVRAIREGAFIGQRIIFAGFSDADGSVAANLELSERRADAIRAAVAAQLGSLRGEIDFEVVRVGEAMPVACNGTTWGERLNRRVEVWVADLGN